MTRSWGQKPSCDGLDLASQAWCRARDRTYEEGTPISCGFFFLTYYSRFYIFNPSQSKVLSMMADNSVVKSDYTKNFCSSCKQPGRLDFRYVACIAQTKYWSGGGGFYINDDQITIWKVHLCPACLPKTLFLYLKGQLRSALKTTGLGLLAIMGGLVMFWVGTITGVGSTMKSTSLVKTVVYAPKKFLDILYVSFLTLLFIAGAIMVAFGIIKVLVNLLKRYSMKASNNVPSRWMDKCFVGEAERSLQLVESKHGPPVLSSFNYPLPAFKDLNMLSVQEHKMALKHQGSVQWRKRRILRSTGNSYQELIDKLPKNLHNLLILRVGDVVEN